MKLQYRIINNDGKEIIITLENDEQDENDVVLYDVADYIKNIEGAEYKIEKV